MKTVKTKQKCPCGWRIVSYVEETPAVKCLDCKATITIQPPELSEYEQWVQNLNSQ